jgi:flagellar FliL protein
MAGEEELEVEAQSGGGKKKLIIIIVAALFVIGGSVAGALFFMGGDDGEAMAEEEVMVEKSTPTYVDLDPPFTVNLDPDDSVGFLQVSMQVLTYNDDVAADIEKHKPLIRNNLVTLFGKQKSIDLRAPEGKEKLQKAVLETIQAIIDKSGGGGEVDNVFFTSFVMQ